MDFTYELTQEEFTRVWVAAMVTRKPNLMRLREVANAVAEAAFFYAHFRSSMRTDDGQNVELIRGDIGHIMEDPDGSTVRVVMPEFWTTSFYEAMRNEVEKRAATGSSVLKLPPRTLRGRHRKGGPR